MLDSGVDMYDETVARSDAYNTLAIWQLSTIDAPSLPMSTIKSVLHTHNGSYLGARRHVDLRLPLTRNAYKELKSRRFPAVRPEVKDPAFDRDVWFYNHQHELEVKRNRQKEARSRKEAEARKEGLLLECPCCFGDEFLLEDMTQCDDGHLFCSECVVRAANHVIGGGRAKFPCLSTSGCSAEFSLHTMEQVLPRSVIEGVWSRLQQEEVASAGIAGLADCPFCNFAVIMPDDSDREVRCLNPACKKVSCRLCREPTHIPLRCHEVEKKDEVAMRTFVENQMTEALCRTCWKCKRKFFKEEGCNHMTCVCKSHMCYICEKPLKPTEVGSHFGDKKDGKCPQYSDTVKFNKRKVAEAGSAALSSYVEEHPEAAEIDLKHNPLGTVPAPPMKGKGKKRARR
mmetsp:Transcript_54062/g.127673  ORF Transcript_54062/g.127673 Transcript_54062/m.127673 type:complete len:399 (-) Transcript_54062:80-1276(-)